MLPMAGKRFGRWLVIEPSHRADNGDMFWTCVCDCGARRAIGGGKLRRGKTKSCGCGRQILRLDRGARVKTEQVQLKHGHTAKGHSSSTYNAWSAMIEKCRNSNHPRFGDYGAKGITVCERWKDFINFFEDMGEKPGRDRGLYLKKGKTQFNRDNCEWMIRIRFTKRMTKDND